MEVELGTLLGVGSVGGIIVLDGKKNGRVGASCFVPVRQVLYIENKYFNHFFISEVFVEVNTLLRSALNLIKR